MAARVIQRADKVRRVGHSADAPAATGPTASVRVPGAVTLTLVRATPIRATDSGRLRSLQSTLGNRVLGRALASPARRAPLTDEERAQDLVNEPYASNQRLQEAFDNAQPLRRGGRGDHIALIQQGLIEDGILLPVTTQDGAAPPDGIFGEETYQGVREFQGRHGLDVDGVVGRQTMGRLDELAVGRTISVPPIRVQPGGTGGTGGELLPYAEPEFIIAALEVAERRTLDRLARDTSWLDSIEESMTATQFGRAAACFCLVMPPEVVHPAEAKREAMRIMSTQLGGDKTATRRAIARIRGVVIPADHLTTDYPPFSRVRGQETMDGRLWDSVRGQHTVSGNTSYSSLPEENLLGIDCTATWTPISGPNAGIPQHIQSKVAGSSIATHEFAHALHFSALAEEDSTIIQAAFTARTAQSEADPENTDMWVDGRRGCYASVNEREFFAQLSSAYLGTNVGNDRVTGGARHNGKEWVQTHEPTVYAILDRIYAGGELQGTNPTDTPLVRQEPELVVAP